MNTVKALIFLIGLSCSISFIIDLLDKCINKSEFTGYEFLVLLGVILSWSTLYYLNL